MKRIKSLYHYIKIIVDTIYGDAFVYGLISTPTGKRINEDYMLKNDLILADVTFKQ